MLKKREFAMKRRFFCGVVYLLSTAVHLYAVELTISAPGIYTLEYDLFVPAPAPDTIIVINSSNVTLDLGGRRIALSTGVAVLNGILINPNLTDVTIKNGTVGPLTGQGITVSAGCSRITIENVKCLETALQAINITGIFAVGGSITDIVVQDLFIEDCGFNLTVSGQGAMQFAVCNSLTIQNVHMVNLQNTTALIDFVGLSTVFCTAVLMRNISVKSGVVQGRFIGINATVLQGARIESCSFTNNVGGGFVGFLANSSTGLTLENYLAEGNFANAPAPGFVSDGIRLESTSQATIKNCLVSANRVRTTLGGGEAFSGYEFLQSSTISIEHCTATANVGEQNQCNGFFVTGPCASLNFIGCQSSFNSSPGGNAAGFAFVGDSAVYGCTFLDCYATGNAGNGLASSAGYIINPGATTGNRSNLLIKNQSFSNNGGTSYVGVGLGSQQIVAASNTNGLTIPWTNVGAPT
jgi:hypothetical protein